jgi:fumarate hydratase class II
MVCCQVFGNQTVIKTAASQGRLEPNVLKLSSFTHFCSRSGFWQALLLPLAATALPVALAPESATIMPSNCLSKKRRAVAWTAFAITAGHAEEFHRLVRPETMVPPS